MKQFWTLTIPIILALTGVSALAVAGNSGDFSGGVAIGTSYAGVDAAPTDGLIVQGNVGIGVASPNGLFDVHAGTNENLLLRGPVDLASGTTIFSVNDANNAIVPLEINAQVLALNPSGNNVGIGTTNPTGLFNVHAGTDQNLLMRGPVDLASGTTIFSTNDANNAEVPLEVNSSSFVINPNGGNVGIGTTSPAYALDVRGTAGATLASNSLPVINKIHVQTFTSSGTYTPSTGMVYALVEVWGGGGGGGGAAAATGESGAAGGAGGGAYARGIKTAATIGSSQTVTVGSGGSGGTAGQNNGSAGGSSSVGTLISAGGGSYGVGAPALSGTGANAGSNGGGTPGGTYDYGVPGQDGWLGTSFGGNSCISGFGGSSGSGSPGGYQVPHNNAGTQPGGYGGGGSGGCTENSTTAQPGGAGAPGLVVITEFISD